MPSRFCQVLFVSLFVILSAPAVATSPKPGVTIENFTFNPAAISIHVGASVTFTNADDIPHSVVMTDGSFHSKALDTGESVVVAFPKVGDYPYFCGLHPHMQGTITVLP